MFGDRRFGEQFDDQVDGGGYGPKVEIEEIVGNKGRKCSVEYNEYACYALYLPFVSVPAFLSRLVVVA